MRLLNENNIEIAEVDIDLTCGFVREETVIRPDALPIDNITKFAWDDGDYEIIRRYIHSHEAETRQRRIDELKRKLTETDYQIIKVVEGAASLVDVADTIRQRAQWRKEINELEDSARWT